MITPMSVAAPAASAAATSSSLSKLPQLELVPVADEPRAGPRRRGRALPGRTRPPRRPARSSGSVVVRSCRRPRRVRNSVGRVDLRDLQHDRICEPHAITDTVLPAESSFFTPRARRPFVFLGICRRYGEVGSSGGLRCRIRGCCLGGGTARGCPAATARALTGARPASAAGATGGARTRSRRGGSRAGCGSALAGACAPR